MTTFNSIDQPSDGFEDLLSEIRSSNIENDYKIVVGSEREKDIILETFGGLAIEVVANPFQLSTGKKVSYVKTVWKKSKKKTKISNRKSRKRK